MSQLIRTIEILIHTRAYTLLYSRMRDETRTRGGEFVWHHDNSVITPLTSVYHGMRYWKARPNFSFLHPHSSCTTLFPYRSIYLFALNGKRFSLSEQSSLSPGEIVSISHFPLLFSLISRLFVLVIIRTYCTLMNSLRDNLYMLLGEILLFEENTILN